MNNLITLLTKPKFNPQRLSGLKLWLSASDFNTLTINYSILAETVSGTSGTKTITASATVAAKLFSGNKIKVGSTDIYTVSSVSTTTITTVETLTATYAALTAIAVGQVSQWNDKSGAGNHATQGTAAAQPTFAAGILNGKSVLTFDGGDSLSLPSGLYSIPNGANTIFTVAKTGSGTNARVITFSASGSSRAYLGNLSSTQVEYQNASSVGVGPQATTTTSAYNIFSCYVSGTTQSISVNGGSAVTNSSGATISNIDAGAIGSNGAGSSLFLTGGIAEIIIYNRALNAAEIKQVNRYLSNKWAITIS